MLKGGEHDHDAGCYRRCKVQEHAVGGHSRSGGERLRVTRVKASRGEDDMITMATTVEQAEVSHWR